MRTQVALLVPVLLMVFMGSTPTHPAVTNVLDNGGFEDGVPSPWLIFGPAGGGVAAEVVQQLEGAAIPESPIEGTCCLHIVVPTAGGSAWDTVLRHTGHVFEAGKKYTLSAFLKSRGGTLQATLIAELEVTPWTKYASETITMTEEWEEYSVTTSVLSQRVDPGAITFHIAFAPGDFWIDGVRFYEGDYVSPSPGPAPPAEASPVDSITTDNPPGSPPYRIQSITVGDYTLVREQLATGITLYGSFDGISCPDNDDFDINTALNVNLGQGPFLTTMFGMPRLPWRNSNGDAPDFFLFELASTQTPEVAAILPDRTLGQPVTIPDRSIDLGYRRVTALAGDSVSGGNGKSIEATSWAITDLLDASGNALTNDSDILGIAIVNRNDIYPMSLFAVAVMPELLVLDDFERYDDWGTYPVWDAWLDGVGGNGTGSSVESRFVNSTPFQLGTVLLLHYDNDGSVIGIGGQPQTAAKYSEISFELDSPPPGFNAIGLQIMGATDNVAHDNDLFYVGLADRSGNVHTEYLDYPVTSNHQVLRILSLDSFEQFMALEATTRLIIGVGDRDNPVRGGSGTISIDDICFTRLQPAQSTAETDDFETQDFSTFDYRRSGDARWEITSDEAVSGHHSAQAGDIDADESSRLTLTHICETGEISFFVKVDSENGYDTLIFLIDGNERGAWSGQQEWVEVSFPVSEGPRTFEWVYLKDSSVSVGEDTAWIDDVRFE